LYAIFVVGTAGSGKSLLTSNLVDWYRAKGAHSITVNLDPGAFTLPYEPDVDVRDYIDLQEVMEKYSLGPNGALILSCDLIATRLNEIQDAIDELRPDYAIIDTPGQMELFAYRESGPFILKNLRAEGKAVLFLFDGVLVSNPVNLVSITLLATSVQLRLVTPQIPVLTKKDLIKNVMKEGRRRWINELGKGELIRCGVSTDLEGVGKLTIFTGIYLEEGYSNPLKKISSSVLRYQQMKLYKDPTRTSYLLILLFVASLLIFSASWLGIHLAKTITTPVEKLAKATEEISKGNLEIEVEPPSSGELKLLTESFNRMVKELKENQEILFQKTKELENRAQFIETVLANVPAGVITIDEKGLLSSANSASLKMLNLPHNVVGKEFREVFGSAPYEDIKNYIDKTFRGRYKISEKEVIIQMDGKTFTFAVNITPFTDTSGNFLGVIMVLEDLTQFVMMQKIAAWREIAQRVAHEIKNPLTPIQLSAERILKNIEKKEKPDKEIIEEGAKTILRETATIKTLVSEFSKFARMPSAQFSQVNIIELIKSVSSLYKESFKDVEFILEFDPDTPEEISADPDQMKRALINIIENAIEAMNGNGKIWIATHFKKEVSRLTIEIADNGPGIPISDRDKLFLPYFSTKKKGRGLGLTIVNEIIAEHKGYLHIEDNKPTGTKFFIELPV